MKNKQEIIEEMQQVAEQMRLDDIEENPDIENEFLTAIAAVSTNALPVQFNTEITDFATTVFCLLKQVLRLTKSKMFKNLLMRWRTTDLKECVNF